MLGHLFRKALTGFTIFLSRTKDDTTSASVTSVSPPSPNITTPPQAYADDEATKFFNQLRLRRAELAKLSEPALIAEYISKEDLISVYDYILEHQNTILDDLMPKEKSAPQYRGHRIEKEKSKLKRSISILKDLSDEFILILDIKRKLKSGEKSKKTKVFSGANKTGKIAWRIDSPIYQKWINLVSRRKSKKRLDEADEEAKLSQKLAQENQLVDTGYPTLLINYSLESQIYHAGKKYKQAHYAPFVEMDFHTFCSSTQFQSLGLEDKYSIANQILKAIQIMHKKNIAHQDIKEENILISSFNGKYYIKITDFGHSTDCESDEKVSLATSSHASPEISLAYKSTTSDHHQYFHKGKINSFGAQQEKTLAKGNPKRYAKSKLAEEYRKPDIKNDMWSIGVVMYRLFYGSKLEDKSPQIQENIDKNSLLKGLLEPIRENRFTIDQALESLTALRQADVKLRTGTVKARR